MTNFFLFQDTLPGTPQLLEEQDVVKLKKKKKKFLKKPQVDTVDTAQPLVDSSASLVIAKHLQVSLQKKDTAPKIVFTNSIFGNHHLIKKNGTPNLHNSTTHDWITVLISSAILMIAILRVFSGKKFRSNFELLFSGRAVNQMMREERSFMSRVSFLLSLSFLVVVPLFLFQLCSYYGISSSEKSPFVFYLQITGAIFCVYAVKVIFLKGIGIVFQAGPMMNENIFSLFLFSEMLGLFLLPVVIGISFADSIPTKYFIYSGLGLWVAAWIYRNFRAFVSRAAEEQVSKFYLLLYLCTLEILPLFILIKVFNK